MLEGVNSYPIKGLLPKRALCASIHTILLEYPDDTQLESHITHAIEAALVEYRPSALRSQLSRSTYARYALRAALGQADEGAMVRRIKEGTELGLVPVAGTGSAPCLVEPSGMRFSDDDDKSDVSQATDEESEMYDIETQSSLPEPKEDELTRMIRPLKNRANAAIHSARTCRKTARSPICADSPLVPLALGPCLVDPTTSHLMPSTASCRL